MKELTILLSTYNGENYLREQLDSVMAQTYSGWTMLIRDDGSTDATPAILREYCEKYPDRINLLPADGQNRGPKNSFAFLLQQTDSEYIAFCDQDDYWLPAKLETCMAELKRAESRYGKTTPLLVFSDLRLVNEKRETIHASFLAFSGLDAGWAQNNTLLCRNVAPGCSMLFNRALALRAGEIPEAAVMHDYWMMLFARYAGHIHFIPQPQVAYRQHGSNSLGADRQQQLTWKSVFRNFSWYLKGAVFYLDRFEPYRTQAAAFASRFEASDRSAAAARAFAALKGTTGRLKRKWLILRYRLKAGRFRENIELILCG